MEHGDTQTAAVSVIFILIGGFAIPLLTMDTTICLLTALIMQIMVEFLTGRNMNWIMPYVKTNYFYCFLKSFAECLVLKFFITLRFV